MSDINGVDSGPGIFNFDFARGVINGIAANGYVPNGNAMANEDSCAATSTLSVATNDVKFGEK